MKLPKRFALSSLLFMMLLTSLVFGYAQWRRQWLIAEAKRLSDYTTLIEVSDDWFWPSVTPVAGIVLRNSEGQLSIADEVYCVAEAKELCESIEKQLRAIGVTVGIYRVTVLENRRNYKVEMTQAFRTLDELVQRYSK